MKERPPPAPKGEYSDDPEYRSGDQSVGWRPSGGKLYPGSKGGWRSNKGVVYEQNYKGKWQPSAPDDYDGPDLTYGGKAPSNDYGPNHGGKGYGNDYGLSSGSKSYANDYGANSGGKGFGNDYGPSNGGKSFNNDYGSNSGGKSFSNDYPTNDYRAYKSDASSPSYKTIPVNNEPPHRFNPKNFRDYNSKDVSPPDVINYHGSDSDKREVRVAPTQGGVVKNWVKSPTNNIKSNWKSSTPSSAISSVWPELKEHSSWTQNPSSTYATTLPPFNNMPDLSHSNPGTASSYVYHNFGSADAVAAQHQGSGVIPPTANGASQATIRPLSSYQVQVNHYTERPVRS
ncbi:feruloyl esterase B-like [Nilaparvata lugens]|uniref:feruloyl esterase B-like n=1 Tax=Nilaparvata lugens TaxID=108931 RepID=UPI00193DB111|nr:feruloyl esterase B-like [Nilaparvata lugens]